MARRRFQRTARDIAVYSASRRSEARLGPAGKKASVFAVGFLWICFVAVLGCEAEPEPERPENLVKEFVERMRRVHGDRQSSRAAYDLLWLEARNNLAERAKRASALAGRKIAPEEMVAPSRFVLKYEPKTFNAEVRGDWAAVTVTGDDPASQHSVVLVVRESGHWRVAIRLPPLPPIRKRTKEEEGE